jgi:WASH complex subunit 7
VVPKYCEFILWQLSFQSEYYLNKTFYNLASVALHDWQSYTTMRVLAWDKYGFEVVDDHLPGHSLEQVRTNILPIFILNKKLKIIRVLHSSFLCNLLKGRDILEIVRNLPKFVQEFTYNLNNQVFIQVNSPNKHLDTVNIRHLANSMRAHGPGLANTTVNATYQFLRPKMHVFSQFLYEEQIRSRLAKDIRQLKLKRQEESCNYPFKVAEKLNKGIRKLGVQDGLTRLDHLRILISHIGNALG